MDWDTLGNQVSKLFNETHQKSKRMSIEKRLATVRLFFDDLVQKVLETEGEHIKAYIKEREPINKKLKKIEQKCLKQFQEMLDEKVYSASSFSAGTNLIGESDLDFNVPLMEKNPMDRLVELATICGEHGYEYEGIFSPDNPGIWYAFQNTIQGVEIEIKIRIHGEHFMKVHHKMHDYLDNKVSKDIKDAVTWIKYNFKMMAKKDPSKKKYYSDFKGVYYEQALSNAGVNVMIYPLV
jgi:hypothetical protein